MAPPSPRRTGRGLGEGSVSALGVQRQQNGLAPPLPSPLLSRGRRGRSRRVLCGNSLNSTAVGLWGLRCRLTVDWSGGSRLSFQVSAFAFQLPPRFLLSAFPISAFPRSPTAHRSPPDYRLLITDSSLQLSGFQPFSICLCVSATQAVPRKATCRQLQFEPPV